MSCTLPSGRTPTANVMGRCLPISSTTTTNPATASARVSVLIRYDSSQRLGGRPSISPIRRFRAVVGPGPLVGELEGDQRHGAIGEPESRAVDVAVLARDLAQRAPGEEDLLHEIVQPHLLPARGQDELRILEGPTEDGPAQELGE